MSEDVRTKKKSLKPGPFPAILGKGPWLELGKICGILGILFEVLNSKKTHLTWVNMCMIYSCVYESCITQMLLSLLGL